MSNTEIKEEIIPDEHKLVSEDKKNASFLVARISRVFSELLNSAQINETTAWLPYVECANCEICRGPHTETYYTPQIALGMMMEQSCRETSSRPNSYPITDAKKEQLVQRVMDMVLMIERRIPFLRGEPIEAFQYGKERKQWLHYYDPPLPTKKEVVDLIRDFASLLMELDRSSCVDEICSAAYKKLRANDERVMKLLSPLVEEAEKLLAESDD